MHGWYRFVLSYPPHLVRQYGERFGLNSKSLLLDPFCGTGTTVVEAKKNRIPSIGCDAHPFAALVSRVKTSWNLSVESLRTHSSDIVRSAEEAMLAGGLSSLGHSGDAVVCERSGLSEDEWKLVPAGFVSERPLRRLLILRKAIKETVTGACAGEREFFLVGLAHAVANGAGNFGFGPEIYRTKAKEDYDVLAHFVARIERMIGDLEEFQSGGLAGTASEIRFGDARDLKDLPSKISAVITSPPYPNEKDYTRTTRVETLLLELISDRASLRGVKEALLRSNTRNVFSDDQDCDEVREFDSVQRICAAIESRRIELKKTSGFERLYHKVVAHYFGGMRRHFRSLRPHLREAAQLAYVVGDQLSFLMVPVPTAQLLGEVAVERRV